MSISPSKFPIGSPESRAAARALFESKENQIERRQIIECIPSPRQDNSVPHVGAWQPMIHGGFMRVVYIPTGTDEETERKILQTP